MGDGEESGWIDYWDGLPFGCDGTVEMTGGGGGEGCATGGRATVFGMYRGPVWPHPASRAAVADRNANADRDFTIRITV